MQKPVDLTQVRLLKIYLLHKFVFGHHYLCTDCKHYIEHDLFEDDCPACKELVASIQDEEPISTAEAIADLNKLLGL
jgi:hypothetical protein